MAVTQLSPIALPGKRYSFSPKADAGAAKGAGPFTMLSVMALPGMRHAFTAKTPYTEPEPEPTPTPEAVSGAMGGYPYPARRYYEPDIHRERILREDKDIMEFIMTLVTSGILDN